MILNHATGGFRAATTAPPDTQPTLEQRLEKYRHWLRDRWMDHRAKVDAAEFPDHPEADYDRHCAGMCQRLLAEMVRLHLAPTGWLLPEDAAAPAFQGIDLGNGPDRQVEVLLHVTLRGADICHGGEVPTP